MTRLDEVKAMTPKEFANWLNNEFVAAHWCKPTPNLLVDPKTYECLRNDGDCDVCLIEWLMEEVN